MTIMLRIILILGSLIAGVSVLKRIRKSKMQIDDAVFWVLFSFMLIIFAIFPQIIYFISELTGTKSPANILYLIIIALLIFKVFSMSIHISVLESKFKKIVQDEALKKIKEEDDDR